jgi:hypothetical protein
MNYIKESGLGDLLAHHSGCAMNPAKAESQCCMVISTIIQLTYLSSKKQLPVLEKLVKDI